MFAEFDLNDRRYNLMVLYKVQTKSFIWRGIFLSEIIKNLATVDVWRFILPTPLQIFSPSKVEGAVPLTPRELE